MGKGKGKSILSPWHGKNGSLRTHYKEERPRNNVNREDTQSSSPDVEELLPVWETEADNVLCTGCGVRSTVFGSRLI